MQALWQLSYYKKMNLPEGLIPNQTPNSTAKQTTDPPQKWRHEAGTEMEVQAASSSDQPAHPKTGTKTASCLWRQLRAFSVGKRPNRPTNRRSFATASVTKVIRHLENPPGRRLSSSVAGIAVCRFRSAPGRRISVTKSHPDSDKEPGKILMKNLLHLLSSPRLACRDITHIRAKKISGPR